jgi:excisionase family DNA binding protein
MADLMNTKQVGRYLGINEKKVYYLAKAGAIPCTRVTGKWIFPKKLIDQWIEESAGALVQGKNKGRESQKPFLLAAGSDDPSLGIMRDLYISQTGPASLFMATVGSSAGLAALRDGVADFALAHLLDAETGEYNLPFIEKTLAAEVAAALLFYRDLGLIIGRGNPKGLKNLSDLTRKNMRTINRQAGSGTRHYFDLELARLNVNREEIFGYEETVSTHVEVGLKVLRNEVDAGLGTETVTRLLGLDFIPLTRERFDILIPKDRFFSRGIQILLGIIGSREFRARVEAMGGYDASESGRIMTSN